MPLYAKACALPLPNELSERDYCWKPGEYIRDYFSSPVFYGHHPVRHDLVMFLNHAALRGPCYVQEDKYGRGEVFHVTIFHPEDHKKFRDRFASKYWRDQPYSAAKNLALFVRQANAGFTYENRQMNGFLNLFRALIMRGIPVNPAVLNNIFDIAWPAANNPKFTAIREAPFGTRSIPKPTAPVVPQPR